MICAGLGVSPVNDGGRLPPVRSLQWTVCVATVPLNVMGLDRCAQVPSNSDETGAHVPHVGLVVWRVSTA